jgi:hypothetical protein
VAGEPRDSQKFFGSFFQKRTKEKVLLFEKRSKNFCVLRARVGATTRGQ